jgi:hypothetical protein
MIHYAVKEDDTQLSWSVLLSHDPRQNDFNYEYIKDIDKDEMDEADKLAIAAHDIIKDFSLYDDGRFILPDRKYIDKLLEVSKSNRHWRKIDRIWGIILRF